MDWEKKVLIFITQNTHFEIEPFTIASPRIYRLSSQFSEYGVEKEFKSHHLNCIGLFIAGDANPDRRRRDRFGIQ